MEDALGYIRSRLFAMQDEQYGDFISGLVPSVERGRIIGVRTPALVQFAKELYGTAEAKEFIGILPHGYYEELNLHGALISRIPDFDEALRQTERLLPFVDNWATCDSVSPKVFAKRVDRLMPHVLEWVVSPMPYVSRYGMGMLMRYRLGDGFNPRYLELVASISSTEYYVNMMRAWFFATALAKQKDATLPYFEGHLLDKWTHMRAIRKALESRRISDELKAYLRSL